MSAMEFRSIGIDGERWPAWLGALKATCGAYVIKSRTSGRVLYVGSSKRLYHTITRHFQQWKRRKKWWSGAYGAGHDPGLTYRRVDCVVAVRRSACGDDALAEETRLIAKLQPRDNLVEHPDGNEIPF